LYPLINCIEIYETFKTTFRKLLFERLFLFS
jgi:hypothetical protein